MQHFIKIISFVIICTSMLISTISLAHNNFISTAPVNGEVFSEAPENFTLRYNDETYLIKLEMNTATGEIIALDFSPSIEAKRSFSIALPPVMADGNYTISWTVEGADTHQLNGEVEFEIKS